MGDQNRSIVLASSNQGKLKEIQALLPDDCILRLQAEFKLPSIEEDGKSFIENAILKARHASKCTGLPAIADDSGLEVETLEGRPGIYSARYAGLNATDAENVDKLLKELRDVPLNDRSARFHCAIAFLRFAEDPVPLISTGVWQGYIQEKPTGYNGFGYDPVFHVPTHQCSAAELAPEEKNRLSHRSQALRKIITELKAELGFR